MLFPFKLQITINRSSIFFFPPEFQYIDGSPTERASKATGGPVQRQLAGPTLRVSDSFHLGWGPRICFSNQLPGHVDAAGLGIAI